MFYEQKVEVKVKVNIKKNHIVQEIQTELEKTTDFFQVKVYDFDSQNKNEKAKLYVIELTKNDKETAFPLNKIEKKHNCNFVVIENHFKNLAITKATTRKEAKEMLKEKYSQDSPKLNQRNKDISHTDLTNLAFMTIDGCSVRDAQDKPIYGDYDDAFYVEKHSDHYQVNVAFADITPFATLIKNDPVLEKVKKIGITLYGPEDEYVPMLGKELEEKVSLLENEKRYVWNIRYNVDFQGSVDYESIKIFRGLIKNRYQANYLTTTNNIEDKEVKENLLNIHQVAIKLKQNSGMHKHLWVYNSTYKNSDTYSAQTVETLMKITKHIIPRFITKQKDYAKDLNPKLICKLHCTKVDEKQIIRWKKELKGYNYLLTREMFSSPENLSQLLIRLSKEKDLRIRAKTYDILNYFHGKAIYSIDHGKHEGAGYEPYGVIKSLRKYAGFINQFVLNFYIYPKEVSGFNFKMSKKVREANELKELFDDKQNEYLQLLRLSKKKPIK